MINMTDNIGPNDILCGRGGLSNQNEGNVKFRRAVNEHQQQYLLAKKKEKRLIAHDIVKIIQAEGGRFLKRDEASNCWLEVPLKKAVEKTSQALREGLDVRHKKIRPPKTVRPVDEADYRNPNKRQRLVEGTVVYSPAVVSVAGEASAVPELKEEVQAATANAFSLHPPAPTTDDCENYAIV